MSDPTPQKTLHDSAPKPLFRQARAPGRTAGPLSGFDDFAGIV